MRIARSLSELRTLLPAFRTRPLCLVPTMGALHEGHGSLVDRGRAEGGIVAVSIFVNPLQFGPTEDLARYPRVPEQDLEFLAKKGADLVFLPRAEELVPPTATTTVTPGPAGRLYCGASRPGHFAGVLTIVSKLFHLFAPEIAIFGEKDRQQLFLIRAMVRDLALPVRVLGHPTVREPDGLAMSSRNRYLEAGERKRAVRLPQLLEETARKWELSPPKTDKEVGEIRASLEEALTREGFRVDYVAFADPETLLEVVAPPPYPIFLLAAVFLGKTRLIDNLTIGPESARV